MHKLNLGCGHRFAKGWINIDFHSEHPAVRRVNLLRRLPFDDSSFDVVYSSHVLEHFTLELAEGLLRECHRVLKMGGLVRIVVPDLENVCREYLQILDQIETSEPARRRYEWIILELLDQLTRTRSSGLITEYRAKLLAAKDTEMIQYVRSRTDTIPWSVPSKSLREKLQRLTLNKLKTKLIYVYISAIKKLFPSPLRSAIVDDSRIGEKHRWMYDRHGLSLLLKRCGFADILFLSATRSQIPNFNEDFLDVEPDGQVYKPNSLYCEARKR
jgi:predicted SAM-dependent methyltransferase